MKRFLFAFAHSSSSGADFGGLATLSSMYSISGPEG